MIALAKPFTAPFRLPVARRGNLADIEHRRQQATVDLIHSSPHLRRDIGLLEEHFTGRHR